MKKIFLTAAWTGLVMANYKVDPQLLAGYLPPHTEPDLYNHTCYISLVGFMFRDVRLKGCRIPFHTHFPEVNLRFYVRYKEEGNWKRGVVFISEIVPKRAVLPGWRIRFSGSITAVYPWDTIYGKRTKAGKPAITGKRTAA